jgi:hypothetical protein
MDRDFILHQFAGTRRKTAAACRAFIEAGLSMGRVPDLVRENGFSEGAISAVNVGFFNVEKPRF